MGGAADHVGNVSAVAEYNIWVDPEAAAIVLRSGLPLVFVGWDVSRRDAVMREADQRDLLAVDTDLARFCHRINGSLEDFARTTTELDGYDLPDPVAMAAALDPGLIRSSGPMGVEIDCTAGRTRGMTVTDRFGVEDFGPNATVVWSVDEAGFKQRLRTACGETDDRSAELTDRAR